MTSTSGSARQEPKTGKDQAGRSETAAGAPGPGRDGGRTGKPATPAGRGGNPVGWTALLLAVLVTVWQVVYAVNAAGAPESADLETYTQVHRFVSLVLSLSAAVLGTVGLAQRRPPRWPAMAGLAVGVNVFVVSVFAWVGSIVA